MLSVGGMSSGMMNFNSSDAQVFARQHDPQFKHSLPLAADYFAKPRLPSASVHEFDRMALAMVDATLERARKERIYGGADDSWRDIGATHGFKRHTKAEGRAQHYRLQGVVRAPMVNVMSVLYAERSAELVERRNAVYGNALDAQTLYVLRARTDADQHQHVTLRWEAMNLAAASGDLKLDATLLEFTGIALDADRQPVGLKIARSVDLPQCAPLLKTHGLHRVDITETMVLRPTANNTYTEVTVEGSFVVEDRVSSSTLASFLSQIAQKLGNLPVEIQSRRLSAMKIMDKSQWVPTNERKNCSVCLSRFGVLGKKHHCRACGEVICKSCVVSRPQKEDIKFCKKCVVVACAEDELVIPDRQPVCATPSSSSSTSSSRHTRESRDSYASSLNRLSEERLSASVYMPQAYNQQQQQYHQQPVKPQHTRPQQHHYQPQQQQPSSHKHKFQPQQQQYDHRMMYVDDLKHESMHSNSMTASETSYGSSIEGEVSDYYRPEGSMIYLDTRQMMRGTPSSVGVDDMGLGSGRGYARAPVAMQNVESSLAQQRQLLQDMMQQANRTYRANAPVQVKY